MPQIQNLQNTLCSKFFNVHQFEFWCQKKGILSNFSVCCTPKECFQCLSSIEIALSAPVSRSNGLLLGKELAIFDLAKVFKQLESSKLCFFLLKTTLLASLRANLGFYRSVDVLFSARVSRIAPLLLINLGVYIHTDTIFNFQSENRNSGPPLFNTLFEKSNFCPKITPNIFTRFSPIFF